MRYSRGMKVWSQAEITGKLWTKHQMKMRVTQTGVLAVEGKNTNICMYMYMYMMPLVYYLLLLLLLLL